MERKANGFVCLFGQAATEVLKAMARNERCKSRLLALVQTHVASSVLSMGALAQQMFTIFTSIQDWTLLIQQCPDAQVCIIYAVPGILIESTWHYVGCKSLFKVQGSEI